MNDDRMINLRKAADIVRFECGEWKGLAETIVKRFEALPSAQQERKKGKWIYNSPVTMKCNQCGLVIKDWDWHRFKYCPNCISDMRGDRMSDPIDRSAALNACKNPEDGENAYAYGDEIEKRLKALPSAQPNLDEWCTDCKEYDHDRHCCPRYNRVIRNAMQSAQPERKNGKWIYGENEYGIDGYHCDKCGFFVPWDYAHKFINYIEDYNFCPNCGAKMDGSEHPALEKGKDCHERD